jgi:hypothetical protein
MGQDMRVKLLLQSAMIFFGTLMAAGLVALGAPEASGLQASALHQTPSRHAATQVGELAWPWIEAAFAPRGR